MFPVMMLVRIVPKDNAVVHGLIDGALAARDRVHEWGEEAVEEDLHDSEVAAVHTSENGSTDAPRRFVRACNAQSPKAKRGATRKTTRSASQEELNPAITRSGRWDGRR